MPSFRRRRVATSSVSAPVAATAPSTSASVLTDAASKSTLVLVVASAPQLFSLVDENDEVSPRDGDLRPRKRKVVDVGGGGGSPYVH